jgi:hypothetical protein
MKDKDHSDPTPPAVEDPRRSGGLALRRLGHKDHFLRLMLFQPSEEIETLRGIKVLTGRRGNTLPCANRKQSPPATICRSELQLRWCNWNRRRST